MMMMMMMMMMKNLTGVVGFMFFCSFLVPRDTNWECFLRRSLMPDGPGNIDETKY